MKRVTTNLTFGQVLFILLILILASLMFFYLGAKFGSDLTSLSQPLSEDTFEPFLPDAKLAAEIEILLNQQNVTPDFYEGLDDDGKPARLVVQKNKPEVLEINSRNPMVVEDSADSHARSESLVKTALINEPKVDVKTKANISTQDSPAVIKKPEVTKKPEMTKNSETTKPKTETAQKVLLPGDVKKQPVAPGKPEPSKVAVKKAPEDKLNVILPQAHSEPVPVKTISEPEIAQNFTGKSYRLQVGSYAQKNRALQAKSEWEARGYSVSVIESKIPGKGSWYRLRIGRFGSSEEAKNAQRAIMQKFQQTAMILESD